MPKGSPKGNATLYRANIHIEGARAYIKECVSTTDKVQLPTIEGLAMRFGVIRDTVALWGKTFPEFDRVLQDLKTTQMEMLINNGLGNRYNSTIAKLILGTHHGMRDNSDITSGGKPIEAAAPVIVMFGEKVDNPE